MRHYQLAFLGFGNVGRALARLLLHKQDELRTRYGITFSVVGIATARHGAALSPQGLHLERVLQISTADGSLHPLSAQPAPDDALSFVQQCRADVLFESLPVNYESGQPAVDCLHAALQQGMHAISANKGPVVHAYHQLTSLAERQGVKYYFESAVMDGAPIFSLFRHTLPAAELGGFGGILNSTTNLILTRMENGDSFDQAVRYAQAIGIAESDPSGDVDGWDAAVKVAALATVLMDAPLKPHEVERQGIRALTPQDINHARAEGKRWKLICTARRQNGRVIGQVSPQLVGAESPFYGVSGTSSIIQFETDVLPGLSIIETDPSPQTTAYGMLADFINAVAASSTERKLGYN